MATQNKQQLDQIAESTPTQDQAREKTDDRLLSPNRSPQVQNDQTQSQIQPAPAKSSVDASAVVLPTPQDTGKEEKERPAYLEDLNEDRNHDVEWMRQFVWLKTFLIIFGRWPFTYTKEPHNRGYIFEFSWTCPGFFIFFITFIFTFCGLIVSTINVIHILMTDKVTNNRTTTEVLEQGLAERHTLILIIILGSYVINTITLFFIFVKRQQISDTFTKWTRFLHFSKLNGGSIKTYNYVGLAVGNYLIVSTIYIVLTCFRLSATFIGGPTVVSILSLRQFFPTHYLENFVGSSRHKIMHVLGLGIYIYVITSCNIYMYLFLWLIKSVESAFSSWNARMIGAVEAAAPSPPPPPPTPAGGTGTAEDTKPPVPPQLPRTPSVVPNTPSHPRLSYQALYHDHIGLVRMLSWFNNIFAYTLEPYVLFITIRIVYQMYLAALVMKSNGKPLNQANVGKYFIRKTDYLPPVLLNYENSFMMLTMFLASSWLEETAYDSYDVLRKNSLLRGTMTDKESFFYLSMFQSYTSTTTMSICGGHFFSINRYTILHVLSAIMSNFLVVYQFAPLFDMDTVAHKDLRDIMGNFLVQFEGLHPNHTIPVADSRRNRISF